MAISMKSLYDWYRAMLRNPKYRWWIVLGSLVYLVSPLDLSPDILPIAGQIDDIAVLTLLLAEVSQIALDYFRQRRGVEVAAQPGADVPTVDVNAVAADD
ncbi:MAG: DUF1232 domain-containing protein [Spirulinaceae cyanobacterium SM2_1_0]|nr:DUF1232 domain-containing protein [Spirulinaceae cyanobacterium SM2_1_0]